jgi:hypothetical protein
MPAPVPIRLQPLSTILPRCTSSLLLCIASSCATSRPVKGTGINYEITKRWRPFRPGALPRRPSTVIPATLSTSFESSSTFAASKESDLTRSEPGLIHGMVTGHLPSEWEIGDLKALISLFQRADRGLASRGGPGKCERDPDHCDSPDHAILGDSA